MGKAALMGIILVAALLSVIGQVFLKLAINHIPNAEQLGMVGLTLAAMKHGSLYIGLALYSVSMVLFLKLLSVAELSYVGLGMSIGFIFLVISSRVALGEAITPTKLTGSLLIAAGVALINR